MPEITVTALDFERLSILLSNLSPMAQEGAQGLDDELERATLVAPKSVAPDVVTMNSRVRFLDEITKLEREVQVVYPIDAKPEAGKVSVLSPVGSALLGLRVGQSIAWPTRNGRPAMRLRVLAVLYQPEAAGHYHL